MVTRVLLRDVRISYPVLYVPRAFKGSEGQPKYSASFILPKDHPSLLDVQAAVAAEASAAWGTASKETLKQLKASNRLPVRDGDAKGDPAYAGNLYINASSYVKPTVFGPNGEQWSDNDGRLYSGCRVNASLEIKAQRDTGYGKRIVAGLRGVMFVRDDEPLSGGTPATAEDFGITAPTPDPSDLF